MEDKKQPSQKTVQQTIKIDVSISPEDISLVSKQKVVKRSKKEHLKQKKKLKNMQKDETNLHLPENDGSLLKAKSDEDNSVTTQDSKIQKIKPTINLLHQKSINLLTQIITKPPYVSISNNKINGDFGHASAIFKRPIIQGSYFLQIMIKQDVKHLKKIQLKSSVRVGICQHSYNCSFPLGCQESIAYKSIDGGFIKNGEKIGEGQPYSVSDVIGVLINMESPHKYPDPNKINKDSSVSFFKNGELIFQFRQLKQIFYCFSVSFFNYSQIEVLQTPHCQYMPAQAKQYFNVLNQVIRYKDLENSKLFRI